MADAVAMKIEGLKELEDKLRAMGPDIAKNALRAGVRAGAVVVKDDAIPRAAQDTGRLQRAIYIKQIRERSGPAQQTFFVGVRSGKKYRGRDADAYYWRFVEFGTARMAARPFLRPAFEAKKMSAVEAIANRIAARIKTWEKRK